MIAITVPQVTDLAIHPDWQRVRLRSPLRWVTDDNLVIEIPAGFESDLASSPRFAWAWIPRWGRHAIPAIIHDWLYHQHRCGLLPGVTRAWCDGVLRDACEDHRVHPITAWAIWAAVRCCGWRRWA